MNNELRFFQAGMPSADGIGLAGFGQWGNPSDEFMPAVTEEGAWPAGSTGSGGDIYASLPAVEQNEVLRLVTQGVTLADAIYRVTTGQPSFSVTTSGAPITRPTNWTPILLIGATVLLFGGFAGRRKR